MEDPKIKNKYNYQTTGGWMIGRDGRYILTSPFVTVCGHYTYGTLAKTLCFYSNNKSKWFYRGTSSNHKYFSCILLRQSSPTEWS